MEVFGESTWQIDSAHIYRPSAQVTNSYTWKMSRNWRLANATVAFLTVFANLGGSGAIRPPTPPGAEMVLATWWECRKLIDSQGNEAILEPKSAPEVWSAVALLRKDGRVIGVGGSHQADSVRQALQTALADARLRVQQGGGDPATIRWERVTLELELGSKPEPLIGGTYLLAAQEVAPALDGLAVRRGNDWAIAHAAVLQSLNAASAPDQTLLSLVMQLGLPAREFSELPATERVGLYRFEATRIVQPEPQASPKLVHRGAVLEPTLAATTTCQRAQSAVESLVEWFERSMIRPSASGGPQSDGEKRALQSLGLRGDYLPAACADETINAPPAEQALAAFALARCATLNSENASLAKRARTLALEILARLQVVDELERDPLADPKSIAWIVLSSLELGESLGDLTAATTLNSNAKGLIAKICASGPQEGLPLSANNGILRGDPLEQALLAAALAALDRAGTPVVDRAMLVQSIDQLWGENSRGQVVGILGWLLLADRYLGGVPERHAAIARAARVALSRAQLGVEVDQTNPSTGRLSPDLVGAFSLSGLASKGATAQTARPGYALALMMTDPTLTPVGEQYRARAMQMGVVRFLLQLTYDDVSSYLAENPQRTIGALRTAPWDSRVAVAGNAMGLLCLEESVFSINSLNSVLGSSSER